MVIPVSSDDNGTSNWFWKQ